MASRERLIDANGQPAYGRFDEPVADINYTDFDLRTPMGEPVHSKKRRSRFNQFQFIAINAEPLFIGLSIVRLRYVSHAFIYLYDHDKGTWAQHRFTNLLHRGLRFGQSPNQDTVSFIRGKNKLSIRATHRPGVRQVRVSLADGTRIRASIDESSHYMPLALCTRTGFNGWTYTQKANARVCHGQVNWAGSVYELEKLRALASIDWTGGYMRRETSWNWASLSTRLHDDRKLGINLASGVNETGFSENTLWLDGVPTALPLAHFQFDRDQENNGWSITSLDEKIRLHFDPVTHYSHKTNALIIASNFKQILGHYNGEIDLPHETIRIDNAWGLIEDHYAKW